MNIFQFGMMIWDTYFEVLDMGKKGSRDTENQIVREKMPPEEASLASFITPNLQ